MKLALHFPNFSLPEGPRAFAPALAATARAADQGGFATMTVMDHWFQMKPLGGAAQPMLEAYTALGFLAAVTERIELGALVTGVTYRYPGLLAKTVATLDVLSGGRALLGLGAAWYEEEHEAYGVPFPPLAERFERLTETLEICEQMWSDDDGPYRGAYYELAETICNPMPLQRPRPPILIGGGGERKTLRLVAEHGDACNLFDLGPEEVGHKLDVLRQHCDDVGRDYDEIEKTVMGLGYQREPKDLVAHLEELAKLGVQHYHGFLPGVSELEPLRVLGREVIPAVAGL
jgi:F420-dependent oxidoreductase-like protein